MLKNLNMGAHVKVGDRITLTNVVERKLFHDEADPASPDCTIKDANEYGKPDGFGSAVFDPDGWVEGGPVFDPDA